MKDPRPGPIFSRADRLEETRRFGSYIFCALMSYGITIMAAYFFIFRPGIAVYEDVILYSALSGGILTIFFVYFAAIKKSVIIIPILRVWTITFLIFQIMIFLVAVPAYLNYGIHNPAIQAEDCAVAAFFSLMAMFFGLCGLIRGIRHRRFAHAIVPGYTRE
jgi:hypothetical protein